MFGHTRGFPSPLELSALLIHLLARYTYMGTSEAPGRPGSDVSEDVSDGVHVELVVGDPGRCPITAISEECGVTVNSVSWGGGRGATDCVEFTMPADTCHSRDDFECLYSTEGMARYQCQLDPTGECACEYVRRKFGPVDGVHAAHGDLYLRFFTTDIESARAVVEGARETFDDVRIRHLTQSGEPLVGSDPVVVDRNCLTDRQREVLETAHEMGYYDHPKRANATEVADELGITQPTFTEHIAAAQRKLLTEVLGD